MLYKDFDCNIIETDERYRSVYNLVANDSNVLDIGCASARFSKYLISKGCKVTGVELDTDAAEKAKGIINTVVCGSIEDSKTFDFLQKYDYILLLDVLEHLVDPASCLKRIRNHLLPGAKVIVSLPNIAHWSVRRELLLGNFNYSENGGLLDINHRTFFTLDYARKTFINSKYKIIKEDYFTYGLPFFNSKRPIPYSLSKKFPLKFILSSALKKFPGLFTYQFLFVLEK